MNKWSDATLKSRYDEVHGKRPGGLYSKILKAECHRRGIRV